MAKLILMRDVLMADCPWLDRDMKEGEVVYQYTGATYGCIGFDGLAVSHEPNMTPFFELPRTALTKEKQDG